METVFAKYRPYALSLLRIVIGLQIVQYGTGKIFKFPVVPMFAPIQPFSLYGAAGLLELILGALVLIGLFTRPAAFVLSGLMAFAYFLGHYPRGFFPVLNGGDLAIIFCFAFLYLSTAGAGPWSVDAARGKA